MAVVIMALSSAPMRGVGTDPIGGPVSLGGWSRDGAWVLGRNSFDRIPGEDITIIFRLSSL